MHWSARLSTRIGALNLDVHLTGEGAPVVLAGPNGAGKTSVLRIIAGARNAEVGRVEVGGRVLCDSAQGLSLAAEERHVGYVPQGYGLFPHLSALDNVAFGLRLRAKAGARDQAHAMLERMQCTHLAGRMPRDLSGGERQRVALARALVVDPELLLLDEPLAAMDVATRRGMRSFLAAHLHARKRPAIVVTHDVRDIVALEAEVFMIEDGRIVQHGRADALATEPATDFVAELFQSPAAP